MFLLREDDVEDGVGATAGLVHVGGSYSPGVDLQKETRVFYSLQTPVSCSAQR